MPISQGFEDWTRRDFQAFVKACERYGRYVGGCVCVVCARPLANPTLMHRLFAIEKKVMTKSPFPGRSRARRPKRLRSTSRFSWRGTRSSLVRNTRRHVVGWRSCSCVTRRLRRPNAFDHADWEKIINNIEKGEAKIKRREEIQAHLRWKMENSPRGDLRINYGQSNKVKVYTEDEDRFLVGSRIQRHAAHGTAPRSRSFVRTQYGRRGVTGDYAVQAGLRRGGRVRPHPPRDPQRPTVPL